MPDQQRAGLTPGDVPRTAPREDGTREEATWLAFVAQTVIWSIAFSAILLVPLLVLELGT